MATVSSPEVERTAVKKPRVVAWARTGAVFLFLFCVTVGSQVWLEAYSRGMGSYPDEAGHFMSGLMVRDYIAAGAPSSPLAYASRYYDHYPALGIGYWPPLFYIAEAFWMLIAGYSRTSVLLFIAVISAGLQFLIFREGRKLGGFPVGLAFGIAFALVPAVRFTNSMVMTDVFVALMCFAATLSLGRYLQRPSWRDAVAFGLLCSLALLSKLSAASLALLPPFAILMSRRFELVRRASTWAPAAIVVLVCGPWFLATRGLTDRGLLPASPAGGVYNAAAEYIQLMNWSVGPVLLPVAFAGAVLAIRKSREHPRWAVFVAQPIGAAILTVLAPVGLEQRYMIIAIPSLLVLAALAVREAAAFLSPARARLAPAVMAALICVFIARASTITYYDIDDGIGNASAYVLNSAAPEAVILVSSASLKETAMVAELASREPSRPGRICLRATKILADTDWNVTYYHQLVKAQKDVLRELDTYSVDYIMLDASTDEHDVMKHHPLLRSTLEQHPEQWQLEAAFVSTYGKSQCRVYRRTRALTSTLPVRPMAGSRLQRTLGKRIQAS